MTEVTRQAPEGALEDRPALARRDRLIDVVVVFAVALAVLAAGRMVVGPSPEPLVGQGVVWLANVAMLVTVWRLLRRRGEGWDHLGLAFGGVDGRALLGTLWRSVVVFLAALAAFSFGAVVMAMLFGRPTPADMSGYNYLAGNLPLLLLALAAVSIVSSFGEEVIYRGFLMTRVSEVGGGSRRAWWTAAGVSAVVFGLIHYQWGPAGIVQTGFMGLALAIAYLKLGRRLWVLVLAHFYLDAILLVQMYLKPA